MQSTNEAQDNALLVSEFSKQMEKFSRLHLRVGLSYLMEIQEKNASTCLFMEQASKTIQKLQERADKLFQENYGFQTTKERLQLLYNEAVALERTVSLLEDYTAMLETHFQQQLLGKGQKQTE